jgi:drug/metabolite transporter (DMT)-like permease
MIGSAACWGFATVMSRDLLDSMPSASLLVVQLCASVAVLWALAAIERSGALFDGALGRASLTGILEPGLAYTVGLLGLAYTTASNASVISSTEPIMIVLLAWIFLRQRPSLRLAICIAIAVAGVIVVSWADLTSLEAGSSNLIGDVLIVAATAFAAGYVVISSRLARDYAPGILAASQQSVGLLFALAVYAVVSFAGAQPHDWSALSPGTFAYAAFSGVVQYAAAFWLYLLGLRYLPAGVAALWLTLIPVFGVIGAMIWLGEQPQPSLFVGGILIVAAIIFGASEFHAVTDQDS